MAPLINVSEAARLLGISGSMVYSMASVGKLPCVRFGTRLLFRPESLEAWVAAAEKAESQGVRL